MSRVYLYVASGVGVSILTAYAAGLAGLYLLIYLTPLFWVIVGAPLLLAIITTFALEKINASAAHFLFWLYAVFIGLAFAGIFVVYSGSEVALTLGVVGAVFALASALGYFARRDLTAMARYFLLGLIIVVLGSVVAAFVESNVLNIALATLAVAVMGGLVAGDTQCTRRQLESASTINVQEVERAEIVGALALYLDLVIFSPGLARLIGFVSSRAANLGRLAPLLADEIEHREYGKEPSTSHDNTRAGK